MSNRKVIGRVLATALLALCFAAPAAAQIAPMPMDTAIRYGHLPSGLTYYIRHNSLPVNRAFFYIAQKVGSVQEDDSQRGLAHFLEHMCFNGSKHFPGNGIISFCERIGVKFGRDINAYTSTDETVYNIDNVPVSSTNVDSCLLILRDWAGELLLDPKEIDKERGVIHEEWRLRSSAMQRILERQLPQLYPGSKYGHRMPIGLLSVIDSFRPSTLRAYYEKWYRPDLQSIVVVGDFNVDEMEQKIKSTFADLKMPANAAPYQTYPVPDDPKPIYIVDKDKELTAGNIIVMYRHDPLPDSLKETVVAIGNTYIQSLISSALNGRLAEVARLADCPFDDASVDFDGDLLAKTKDAFYLNITPKPGKSSEALETAMQEIERARRYGLTDGELIRAKDDFLSGMEQVYDNRNKQRSPFYVRQYVRHFLEREPLPSIADEYEADKLIAAQVRPQDVNTYFRNAVAHTDTNFVVLAVFPDKEGVSLPTIPALQGAVAEACKAKLDPYVDKVKAGNLVDSLRAPGRITKTEKAPFGYTCLRLSNGARVYYKATDFNDSQIICNAFSFGGWQKTADKDLSDDKVFDYVMNSTGLGRFSATDLEKKLAGKQVSTRVSLNYASETISGNAAPKDLRTLFEMLYLHFSGPSNDPDGYQNVISSLRTQLENAAKRPETAFSDSVEATMYDHNPIERRISLSDLDKVSYDNIRRIYSERFASPGDFDFFFTGNINADSLRLFAEKYIASLPACKKREPRSRQDIASHSGEIVNRFTRSMETPKTYIFLAYNGYDKYSLKKDIVSDMCGQILRKIYTRTIREEAGISYAVQADASYNYSTRDAYMLEVICPVKPAKADSALLLIRQGLEQVAAAGPDAKDLEDVKKYELKAYADRQLSNGYWSRLINSMVCYGQDGQTDYVKTVNSVTPDDIRSFLRDTAMKQNNKVTVIMMPADLTDKQ